MTWDSVWGESTGTLWTKCSELGLQGPARVKGGTPGGESVASLSEEIHVCPAARVLGVPGTPKELERQIGTGNEVLLNWKTALLISAMEELCSMKNA